jgi:hypothetical protein
MDEKKRPPPQEDEQRDSINPDLRPTPGSAEGEPEDADATLDAQREQKH